STSSGTLCVLSGAAAPAGGVGRASCSVGRSAGTIASIGATGASGRTGSGGITTISAGGNGASGTLSATGAPPWGKGASTIATTGVSRSTASELSTGVCVAIASSSASTATGWLTSSASIAP